MAAWQRRSLASKYGSTRHAKVNGRPKLEFTNEEEGIKFLEGLFEKHPDKLRHDFIKHAVAACKDPEQARRILRDQGFYDAPMPYVILAASVSFVLFSVISFSIILTS